MPSIKQIELEGKCRRGKKEYLRQRKGERLTRGESILAYCYECSGYGDEKYCPNQDCQLWTYRKGKELPNPMNKAGDR